MKNFRSNTQLNKKSQTISKTVMVLTSVMLVAFSISMLIPLTWVLIASFKDPVDYALNVFSLPEKWMIQNYTDLFKYMNVVTLTRLEVRNYGFVEMFGFSTVIATVRSFMGVLVSGLTAYIVSKYNFKLKSTIYLVAIIVMIVPIVGAFPSQMLIYKALGLHNNLLPFLIFTAGPFGFDFILLYGAFKGISWEYAEAAFIDGAGHFRVMFTIMFPMMMPTFFTLFVMGFIGNWNDYMTPVIWLPSYPNLAYGMFNFQAEAARKGLAMPVVLAGFVVVAVPASILYLLSQKTIMSNMRVGGLKG